MTAPVPAQPVHLAEPSSYTGNTCRTAWDNVKYPDGPLVTDDLDEVRCRKCRDRLLAEGRCPVCGEHRLSWNPHPKKPTSVVDGRLTMNDVTAVFYLACDWCSATLIPEVDLDTVARYLTHRRYLP